MKKRNETAFPMMVAETYGQSCQMVIAAYHTANPALCHGEVFV